jgi:uncharacterized protein (TIGR02246 family)
MHSSRSIGRSGPLGSRYKIDPFRAALAEHLGALEAKDAARFATTLGRDVVVVDGRGNRTSGTERVLQSHVDWFALPEWTFDYDVIFTRTFDGAALALIEVVYRHTPLAEPANFLLSLVFERDGEGAWKFVYDQNTPLPTRD